MLILLILGVLIGAAVVIFALQNVTIITVSFFEWHHTGSLSIIIILAVWVGVLTTLLIFLPRIIGNYFMYRALKKEILRLEEELRKQKELTVFEKNAHSTVNAIEQV